jgi:OOP family OmpA-OmpF porin
VTKTLEIISEYMRKNILLLLLISSSVFSQNDYNKLSFEFASGFSKPMTNVSNTGGDTFMSAPNWNLGLRYMFTPNFGLKGSFNYDSFEEKGIGSKHNRFNLDAYYNIGNWFNLNYVSNSSVALYSHLGAGATYVNSKVKGLSIGYIPGWERQINFNIGVSPRFRMNDIMSLYTDLNYIMALKQHYNYSGEPIVNAGSAGIMGSHFTFSLGLSFSKGNQDDHVDFN